MPTAPRINVRIAYTLACAIAALSASTIVAHAQSGTIKPGLWETSTSTSRLMTLPPDLDAKISAMTPAQQAQVRSMVGGGGPPIVVTSKSCIAPGSTLDTMLDRARQSAGMQCSFSNRTQTAAEASFDIACTGKMANAKGHTVIHNADSEHVTMTSHMTMSGADKAHPMNGSVDATATAHYVGTDCGDVKPYTPPPAK